MKVFKGFQSTGVMGRPSFHDLKTPSHIMSDMVISGRYPDFQNGLLWNGKRTKVHLLKVRSKAISSEFGIGGFEPPQPLLPSSYRFERGRFEVESGLTFGMLGMSAISQ